MQAEGHFLQPILLGRAVSLHPLAVLLGLAVGATLAGIVGALLVIPVLAFAVAFIRGLDPDRFDTAAARDCQSTESSSFPFWQVRPTSGVHEHYLILVRSSKTLPPDVSTPPRRRAGSTR